MRLRNAAYICVSMFVLLIAFTNFDTLPGLSVELRTQSDLFEIEAIVHRKDLSTVDRLGNMLLGRFDWIAIVPAGTDWRPSNPLLPWAFTTGLKSFPPDSHIPAPNGNVRFTINNLPSISGLPPGEYQAVYYGTVSGFTGKSITNEIQRSLPFTISAPAIVGGHALINGVRNVAPSWTMVSPTSTNDRISVVSTVNQETVFSFFAGSGTPIVGSRPGISMCGIQVPLPDRVPAGEYQFVYFSNLVANSPLEVARSIPFSIPALSGNTIQVSPNLSLALPSTETSFWGGRAISLHWSNIVSTTRFDWISLVPEGSSSPIPQFWMYTTGSTLTPRTEYLPASNGTITATLPNLPTTGRYQFAYHPNHQGNIIARGPAFTIFATQPRLSLSSTSARSGESVTVSWTNVSPTFRFDWIALVREGETWTGAAPNLILFPTGETSIPHEGFFPPTNGSVTFTIPQIQTTERFQFVYLSNGSLNVVGRSPTFTIGN